MPFVPTRPRAYGITVVKADGRFKIACCALLWIRPQFNFWRWADDTQLDVETWALTPDSLPVRPVFPERLTNDAGVIIATLS